MSTSSQHRFAVSATLALACTVGLSPAAFAAPKREQPNCAPACYLAMRLSASRRNKAASFLKLEA